MNVITIPEKREDRITRLSESLATLKKEFVGLDEIIDQIGESISSWYITPEIISRPVVISLWGMTGTGKSSVVRRLVDLLGLGTTAMFFDCGQCASENKDIPSMICQVLGLEDDDTSKWDRDFETFVFDEFQYARTLDEEGKEDLKPSLRPIWSLIDSGIIDMTDSYNYEFVRLCDFVEDLEPVAHQYPSIKVSGNVIKDPSDVKIILETLGFMHYSNRDIPGILTGEPNYPFYNESDVPEGEDEESKNPYRPLEILDQRRIRAIVKKMNEVESGTGQEVAKKIFENEWTLAELYKLLTEVRNSVARPKKLNCQKALVFVIGNLDEAFQVEDDANPDLDADMFYDITSRVTINDMKNALASRFRAEQVARLGNNLIKYPVLRRDSFEKIIKKEVDRIIEKFNALSGIKLTVTQDTLDLLYSEGVYPTHGVRPVFTTITSILTPYLSKILLGITEETKDVTLSVVPENRGNYKTDTVGVEIIYGDGPRTQVFSAKLQLGALRNPESRKKRYICSVHEAGHAIAYAWRTGKVPSSIISVATDHGGFCSTYDKDKEGEIDSRRDIDNSVAISFAGYLAEKLIYGDRQEMCLMGASSDMGELWSDFASNAYSVGYFEPIPFANQWLDAGPVARVGSPDPGTQEVEYFDGTKFTGLRLPLPVAIRKRLNDIQAETYRILQFEVVLLKKLALELGEVGSMTGERFMEFVKEYGSQVTEESMAKTRETYGTDYYKAVLEGE